MLHRFINKGISHVCKILWFKLFYTIWSCFSHEVQLPKINCTATDLLIKPKLCSRFHGLRIQAELWWRHLGALSSPSFLQRWADQTWTCMPDPYALQFGGVLWTQKQSRWPPDLASTSATSARIESASTGFTSWRFKPHPPLYSFPHTQRLEAFPEDSVSPNACTVLLAFHLHPHSCEVKSWFWRFQVYCQPEPITGYSDPSPILSGNLCGMSIPSWMYV